MLSQIIFGFTIIPLKFQSHVFSPYLPIGCPVFNFSITRFIGADQFVNTVL